MHVHDTHYHNRLLLAIRVHIYFYLEIRVHYPLSSPLSRRGSSLSVRARLEFNSDEPDPLVVARDSARVACGCWIRWRCDAAWLRTTEASRERKEERESRVDHANLKVKRMGRKVGVCVQVRVECPLPTDGGELEKQCVHVIVLVVAPLV